MAQRLEAVRPNRIPPHNLDAEQSVLGAMLESKEAIANVIEILQPDDFYKPAHTEIYETVLALYARGEAVDAITVADELTRRGKLEAIGGKPYIHGLLEAYPTASSAGHYARIVEELSLLRGLIDAGNKVQEIGFSVPEDVAEAVNEAEELVFNVGDKRLKDDYHEIRKLLMKSMTDIETLYERGANITGLSTGFHDLDDMTSGFQPSNLIIVAARPSQGKSSLMNDFALHAATRQKAPVLMFTLEMSKDEVVKRFLSSEAQGRRATDQQGRATGAGLDATLRGPRPSCGGSDLHRRLREHQHDGDACEVPAAQGEAWSWDGRRRLPPVDAVAAQVRESPARSVGDLTRNLKILARELEVPVVCGIAAEPRCRDAVRQTSDARGPPRIGRHRTGRGPSDVHLPRRGL